MELLDNLNNYQLLKKDYVQWNYLQFGSLIL